MSVRPLRLFGDPVLRTACDPVVRFDDALARLVTDLLETVAEPGRPSHRVGDQYTGDLLLT